MDAAPPPPATPYPDFDPALSPLAVDLVKRRLNELERLTKLGSEKIRRLAAETRDGLPPSELKLLIGRNCFTQEYQRLTRSVCQIVVLELELLGLRPAPDRSEPAATDAGLETPDSDRPERETPESERERPEGPDLADRPESDAMLLSVFKHYRRAPLDIVVAEIREAIGADAPPDDPFAPPPGRVAKSPTVKLRPTKHRPAGMVARTASSKAPAPKAAFQRPVFATAPAKPRRALDRLLSTTARNRGPPF